VAGIPPDRLTEAGEMLDIFSHPELPLIPPLTIPRSCDDIIDVLDGRILAILSLFVSMMTS